MAVNNNPYKQWEQLKSQSDYRSTDTQIISLVRQQLSNSLYLRDSYRINPGPYRKLRTKVADSKPEVPHPLGSEDMWGWQKWTQLDLFESNQPNIAENLFEQTKDSEIPGKDYSPISEIGGASF